MKRRDFIKKSSLAAAVPMLPAFLKPFEAMATGLTGHRNLVIIQLSGGNDGLNTIVPVRNDLYYQLRPQLGIPKAEALPFDNSFDLAMHPALKGLRQLYDDGAVSIINGVGYPNPDRSHFRSMDIWHTGSDSDEYWSSGWLGRYLDANCQNVHDAIEVDDTLSLAMKGEERTAMAVKNAKQLHNMLRDPFFGGLSGNLDEAMLSEDNMGYLYKTLIDTRSSASYIYEKSKVYTSSAEYPQSKLARQLKTVSQFINSGLDTQVYYVSLGGFDTHAGQKNPQQRLLQQYGDSVAAFVKDLKSSGKFKDTLILTFSEFGRRVKQNASNGTDHGTANNLFIIGEQLKKPGVYNNLPGLDDLDKNGDLKFSVDFRNVYSTVLKNWMKVDEKLVLKKSYDTMNFV